MTTSHPPFSGRLRAAALASAALALLTLSACGGEGEPDVPAPTSASGPYRYVGLGDSYTAVSGTGPFSDDACFRSDDSYPDLLAKKLGITAFANVSCGGASSENLTASQYPKGGKNAPQLQAVSKKTTLVTLGMGLNDPVGPQGVSLSAALLLPCFAAEPTSPLCAPYIAATDAQLNELIAKVGVNLASDLQQIKDAAAPDARIVLVGYPRVLAKGKACSSQLPLPKAAAARYRQAGALINDVMRSTAQQAGVDFLDVDALSVGHELCSKDPWVNGQTEVPGEAEAFHPFPAYHVAVADALAALLAKN